jgi:hypothetical protein
MLNMPFYFGNDRKHKIITNDIISLSNIWF